MKFVENFAGALDVASPHCSASETTWVSHRRDVGPAMIADVLARPYVYRTDVAHRRGMAMLKHEGKPARMSAAKDRVITGVRLITIAT